MKEKELFFAGVCLVIFIWISVCYGLIQSEKSAVERNKTCFEQTKDPKCWGLK